MNGWSDIWILGLLSSMCDSFSGEWLAGETTVVVHCAAPALTLSGHTDINRALPNGATNAHPKHCTQVFSIPALSVYIH